MHIPFPTYRNSFHPAWLLLLLPPCLAFMVTGSTLDDPRAWALYGRLALTIALLAPVVWLRSAPAAPGSRRFLKELRAQLPGCLVAVLIPGLLALSDVEETRGWIPPIFGLGCLLMGASAFGSEFEQRTMAGLLGQPKSRGTLYLEKLGLLGLLLVFAWTNLALVSGFEPRFSLDSTDTLIWSLTPLFVFCTAPLYSLLTRSTLAGMIFTLTAPAGFCLVGTLVLQLVRRVTDPGLPVPEWWVDRLLFAGIPPYLLLGTWLGWVVFRRLEVREGGAGSAHTGFHPLSLPMDSLLGWVVPAGGTGRLVRKELRLHVVPWLVAGLMVGLWLLWMAARWLVTDEELKQALANPEGPVVLAIFLGLLTLLVAGAACVAEERQLGTLDWQLTQPATLGRQWFVKASVAGLLAVVLGVLLPWGLLWTAFGADFLNVRDDSRAVAWAAYSAAVLTFFTVALFASSVSRNTMKATATAVFIGGGLAGVLALTGMFISAHVNDAISQLRVQFEEAPPTGPVWAPTQSMILWFAFGGVALGILVLLTAFIWLAGRNFRSASVPASTVFRQLTGLVLGTLLLAVAFGAGLERVVLQETQAGWVREAADQRRQARETLRNAYQVRMAAGPLDPAVFQRLGISPDASPAMIADAIVQNSDARAINDLLRSLRPGRGASGPFLIDPALAERYGLPAPELPPNSAKAGPVANPQFYQMDPALARRYGLIPTNQPPATKVTPKR